MLSLAKWILAVFVLLHQLVSGLIFRAVFRVYVERNSSVHSAPSTLGTVLIGICSRRFALEISFDTMDLVNRVASLLEIDREDRDLFTPDHCRSRLQTFAAIVGGLVTKRSKLFQQRGITNNLLSASVLSHVGQAPLGIDHQGIHGGDWNRGVDG